MDPQSQKPTPKAPQTPADAARDAGPSPDQRSVEAASVPVPVPEKAKPLWKRLSLRNNGRRPILGTIDEQLELIRTRLEVVEEQLRSLGGALGRTVDRVGDRIDESTQGSALRVERRLDDALAGIGTKMDGQLRGALDGLVPKVDRSLARMAERVDERVDSITGHLRSDLGVLHTQLSTRVDGLSESVARVQREAIEAAREDRDRLEGRLTELWEVGDQLNQIEELLERALEAREAMSELGARVRTLTWGVAGLGVLTLLLGAGLVAAQLGLFAGL